MEITKQRLEREYNLNIIITTPSVTYKLYDKKNKVYYINNNNNLLPKNKIKKIKEPISTCNIITPQKYIGKIINLCIKKRGKQKKILFYEKNVLITYEIPTSEIITNFSDKLKSISSGYASFNYSFKKFKKSNIVSLDILINKKKVEILSSFVHKKNVKIYGKKITEIIKKTLPRQQFDITIQSAYNNKIISKSKIKALRKNVTSKCYGGDISRKKKLLQKQKQGKKKMKKIGNIFISQETFLKILKIN